MDMDHPSSASGSRSTVGNEPLSISAAEEPRQKAQPPTLALGRGDRKRSLGLVAKQEAEEEDEHKIVKAEEKKKGELAKAKQDELDGAAEIVDKDGLDECYSAALYWSSAVKSFKEIQEKLDAKDFANAVRKLEGCHIPGALQVKANELKQILDRELQHSEDAEDDTNATSLLSANQLKYYNFLKNSDAQAAKTMLESIVAVEAKLRTSKTQCLAIKAHCLATELCRAVEKIHFTLYVLGCLSQAEGSVQSTKRAKEDRRQEEANRDPEGHLFAKLNPNEPANELVRNLEPIEASPFSRQILEDDPVPQSLMRLYTMLQRVLEKASFLKRVRAGESQKEYKDKIAVTTSKLQDYIEKAIYGDDETVDKIVIEELEFPGPTCQKVHGVHEVFLVIMEYICLCRTLDNASDHKTPGLSPKKIQGNRGKVILDASKREKCIGDFTLWKNNRYVMFMRDDSLQVTIALKPGQRTREDVLEMSREAQNQTLSHEAKSVAIGFNFAGAGVDTHATGIAGSLAHVEILQLKTTGTGSTDAKLTLQSTTELPLMSTANYDRWFDSDVRYQEQVEKMKTKLYGNGGFDQQGIALGFKALWQLTGSQHIELFGPKWDKVSPHLSTLLGTGTFGLVYRYKENAESDETESVIKISRFGQRSHLLKEAQALNHLNQWPNEYIPSLIKWCKLKVVVGNVKRSMPAIVMPNCGESVLRQLDAKSLPRTLLTVGRDVQSALSFIHEHNVSHNDVSPKNILLCKTKLGTKAILIDFTLANEMGGVLKGFCGTVAFVHSEIQQQRSLWCSHAKYDETSLGFTMAALAANGHAPWKGFSNRPVSSGIMLKERREKALRTLTDLPTQLEAEYEDREELERQIEVWKAWIRLDEEMWLRKCSCQKSSCSSNHCHCRRENQECSEACECQNGQSKATRAAGWLKLPDAVDLF